MEYEFREGDVVRCWDSGYYSYSLRIHTGVGNYVFSGDGRKVYYEYIEPAHPSEHVFAHTPWAPVLRLDGRDMSHILPIPGESEATANSNITWMARNKYTGYTSRRCKTYPEAVGEAKRMFARSREPKSFEILKIIEE